MWLERLTGVRERSTVDVASQFTLDGPLLTSRVNGRRMHAGTLEIPTLAELRRRRQDAHRAGGGGLRVSEVVGDVQELHQRDSSAGAVFQVASQFNLLEMVSPDVTPERGIEGYEADRTQGPACAIACGAGTIYRQYLVPIDGHVGQTASRQLDTLAGLASALGLRIEMRNGYALPTLHQLRGAAERLEGADESTRDELMGHLRVGIQRDTEVTLSAPARHTVTQVYCSALPVAYTDHARGEWEPLARLVLDAAYEACFAVAVPNAEATGNDQLFLTLLGGGAFGNATSWIIDAIRRSLVLYRAASLEVQVVSYGRSRPEIAALASDAAIAPPDVRQE